MTTHRNGAVLVPADLSVHSMNAAWRAALVARELGAPVRLLYAGEDPDEAREALQQLARDIGGHLGLRVEAEVAAGDPLAQTIRAARDATLVVLGSRRGNPLRELVLGTQAERLIRLCPVPVLVVKRPATGSYRRVLVAAAFDPQTRAAIAAAARLSRDPRMEVLHALDVRDEIGMRACDVPEVMVRRHRQRAAEQARAALQELVAQAGTRADAVFPAIGFGEPAAVLLGREQAMRAELLVAGKRTRGLLADFLLGSVTQRLLARAKADVLVLPHPRRSPRPLSARRAAPA
jgi:nucleotide-binding universal stress UspA family protein